MERMGVWQVAQVTSVGGVAVHGTGLEFTVHFEEVVGVGAGGFMIVQGPGLQVTEVPGFEFFGRKPHCRRRRKGR